MAPVPEPPEAVINDCDPVGAPLGQFVVLVTEEAVIIYALINALPGLSSA